MIVQEFVLGPLATNSYIVHDENSREAVCIDPADFSPALTDYLDGHDLSLEYIVNTHAHADHAGGNCELKERTGAQLLVHEKEVPILEHIVELGRMFGLRLRPSPAPDRFVKEGDTVTAGNLTLHVLDTPGHSPGSISLYADNVVFVGDLLFAGSVGRTDLPGGSWPALLESIKHKILPLGDDTVVYNGHGPSTTVGRERLHNPYLRDGAAS